MMFSATLDGAVSQLVDEFLHDPVLHAIDDESFPRASVTHHVFVVGPEDRARVVRELAAGGGRRMLFTRTKHGAKKWAANLTKTGVPAVDLHGNLSQNARQRNLAAFTTGTVKVIVATDIAARGIHVDDVELVVHVDPPVEHKSYLHRSGRTARAGAGGTVVTMALPDQAADVRKLLRQTGTAASTTTVTPGHPAITRVGRAVLAAPPADEPVLAGAGAGRHGTPDPLATMPAASRPRTRQRLRRRADTSYGRPRGE